MYCISWGILSKHSQTYKIHFTRFSSYHTTQIPTATITIYLNGKNKLNHPMVLKKIIHLTFFCQIANDVIFIMGYQITYYLWYRCIAGGQHISLTYLGTAAFTELNYTNYFHH